MVLEGLSSQRFHRSLTGINYTGSACIAWGVDTGESCFFIVNMMPCQFHFSPARHRIIQSFWCPVGDGEAWLAEVVDTRKSPQDLNI
jgi:hypothetical protein